jgi:hypothetical protein
MSGYSWTVSAGGTITAGANTNSITVTWNTSGAKTVRVNYINNLGCAGAQPTIYDVNVLPLPVPTIAGPTYVCVNSTGSIYNTESGMSGYTWTVSAGGTITSGSTSSAVTISWNTVGPQTVTVNYNAIAACAGIQPTVYNVYVASLPVQPGTITGTTTVCAGTQGVAYTVPVVAYATSYSWTLPSGATIASGASTNSILVNFSPTAVSGVIKVNGVNSCGSGISSPNFNVTVNPMPSTPVITKVGDTLVSSAATGNQWFRNGVAIPGATGMKHRAVSIGSYTVVVTQGGCSSLASNALVLTSLVAIPDLEFSHSFDVYPNPSKGQLNVKVVSGKPVDLNIEIYNNVGVLQWKQEKVHIDGTYLKPVDLRSLPAGVYMVVIRNMDIKIVRKIVILK